MSIGFCGTAGSLTDLLSVMGPAEIAVWPAEAADLGREGDPLVDAEIHAWFYGKPVPPDVVSRFRAWRIPRPMVSVPHEYAMHQSDDGPWLTALDPSRLHWEDRELHVKVARKQRVEQFKYTEKITTGLIRKIIASHRDTPVLGEPDTRAPWTVRTCHQTIMGDTIDIVNRLDPALHHRDSSIVLTRKLPREERK